MGVYVTLADSIGAHKTPLLPTISGADAALRRNRLANGVGTPFPWTQWHPEVINGKALDTYYRWVG